MEKKKVEPINSRKFYTLFIIIMPSILMALMSSIDNIAYRVILQGLTFVFQIIVVKGILDDFYDER